MAKLEVYIADDCWACRETPQILADVMPLFPFVQVEVLDLHGEQRPDYVFATPTYMLDGRIIFLGNPTREELSQKLAAGQQASLEQG